MTSIVHLLSTQDIHTYAIRIHPTGSIISNKCTLPCPKPGPYALGFPLIAGTTINSSSATAQIISKDRTYTQPIPIRKIKTDSVKQSPSSNPSVSETNLSISSAVPQTPNLNPKLDYAYLSNRERMLDEHAAIARRTITNTWLHKSPPIETWSRFFEKYESDRYALAIKRYQTEALHKSHDKSPIPVGIIEFDFPHIYKVDVHLEILFHVQSDTISWTPRYTLGVIETNPLRVHVQLHAQVDPSARAICADADLHFLSSPLTKPYPPPSLSRLMVSGFQAPPQNHPDPEERTLIHDKRPPYHTTLRAKTTDSALDVKSQPESHQFLLFETKLIGDIKRVAYLMGPVQSVRRIAHLTLDRSLPKGPVNLIWKGQLVGQTIWPGHFSNKTVEVDLGPESYISVQKKYLRYPPKRVDNSHLWAHKFYCELALHNLSETPFEIEVLGQLPVASSQEVSVVIHELARATKVDNDTGFTYAKQLLPGLSTRTHTASFSIYAPRSTTVEDPP